VAEWSLCYRITASAGAAVIDELTLRQWRAARR
jgi:hypothetical protein